jgi:hypothetical protein
MTMEICVRIVVAGEAGWGLEIAAVLSVCVCGWVGWDGWGQCSKDAGGAQGGKEGQQPSPIQAPAFAAAFRFVHRTEPPTCHTAQRLECTRAAPARTQLEAIPSCAWASRPCLGRGGPSKPQPPRSQWARGRQISGCRHRFLPLGVVGSNA